MLTAPITGLFGQEREFWSLEELGCPLGRLLCAICPGEAPEAVLETLHSRERTFAMMLGGDRRREWIAGRYCLAAALDQMGAPRVPLLSSPNGAPLLTEGWVGSISHKGPLSVALADQNCRGVGVDVEYADDADLRLAAKVLSDDELRTLRSILDESAAVRFVMLHFSAKEAIYKCVGPPAQSTLDFEAIQLNVDPKELSRECEWVPLEARIRGADHQIRVSARFGGRWLLSAAKQH